MVKKVCIDPGHGGYDPGAVGSMGLKEKDVTLAVALKTGLYLQNAGIAVVFTRTSDQVPWPADTNQDLAARCRIANHAAVNLFVSIHCNSANRNAHGTETYSLSERGEGRRAASLIHAELVKAIKLYDRGLKTANFFVLRRTSMPAVLVELAFISNPQEEKLLRDPAFQDKAARAIAKGIAAWFGVQLQEQAPPQPAEPRLMINGVLVTDVPFKIIDGHTYIHLKSFAEKLGYEVRWHEKERLIYVLPKSGQ